MATQEKPKRVKLTAAEADALIMRIQSSNMLKEDQRLIGGVISFMLWLEQQLQSAKFTISRLKKLFGFKSTEKKSSQEMGLMILNHDQMLD